MVAPVSQVVRISQAAQPRPARLLSRHVQVDQDRNRQAHQVARVVRAFHHVLVFRQYHVGLSRQAGPVNREAQAIPEIRLRPVSPVFPVSLNLGFWFKIKRT